MPPPDRCEFQTCSRSSWGAGGAHNPGGAVCCPSQAAAAPAQEAASPPCQRKHSSPRSCAMATLHGNSGEVSCPVISSTIFKFLGNVCKLQQLSWDLGHLLFTQLSWKALGLCPESTGMRQTAPALPAGMWLLWEKSAAISLCSTPSFRASLILLLPRTLPARSL